MKPQAPQIVQTLTSTPLPMMLEKLGLSIAKAQAALDANSIKLAQEMASQEIAMGDESHNLISLGFAPTFYAFTEASVEIKMEFSITESEEYGGSFQLDGGSQNSGTDDDTNTGGVNSEEKGTEFGITGLSVSGHYARKFGMSLESSSSIAAKIVSLPAPDIYFEILKSKINNNEQ